jgi:polyhydroxyalkanoate synthesis repressor PhaR
MLCLAVREHPKIQIIKKYPNRRLCAMANREYIALTDGKKMVLDQIEFQVVDAKTGEDLTRSIWLQIIVEEKSRGVTIADFSAWDTPREP